MVTTAPVTIEQAAALLNVSATTIRRRIKAGTLQVTEARRPQGVVWLVHLPPGTTPAAETDTADTASVATTAATPQPPGEAMAALIQATLTPIIAPLVAQIEAHRQMVERQAEQLVAQAGTIGELRVTVAQLQAQSTPQTAQMPSESIRTFQTFLTRWWPLVATLAVAITLIVVLVPR